MRFVVGVVRINIIIQCVRETELRNQLLCSIHHNAEMNMRCAARVPTRVAGFEVDNTVAISRFNAAEPF